MAMGNGKKLATLFSWPL